MRPLAEYINEAVKITARKDGYKLIELVSHENVDCPNLTKEEFYDLLMPDLEKAQDEYSDLVFAERKRNIEAIKKWKEEYVEKLVQARYKRKSMQDEYREKLRFKHSLTEYDLNKNATISFDLLTKVDNAHPDDTLNINISSLKSKLNGLWNELQKSEWWKCSNGWKICYVANPDGFLPSSYRSEIVLSMPEDKVAEKNAKEEALARGIEHFYATSKYAGD